MKKKVLDLYQKNKLTRKEAENALTAIKNGKTPSCIKSDKPASKGTKKTASKGTKKTTAKTGRKKMTKEEKKAKADKKTSEKLISDLKKVEELLKAKKITKEQHDKAVARLKKGSSWVVVKKSITREQRNEEKKLNKMVRSEAKREKAKEKRAEMKKRREERRKNSVQNEKLSDKTKAHYCPSPNSKLAKEHPELLEGFKKAMANAPEQFKKGRSINQLWRDYITSSPEATKKNEKGKYYAVTKDKKGKKRRVYNPRKIDSVWGI